MGSENLKKTLYVLVGLLSVALIIFVAFLTRNEAREFNYIGRSAEQDNTITISGTAKTVVVPDIAKIQLGVFTTAKEVVDAQKENTDRMNTVIDALKKLDIDEQDIKTAYYNVDPQYSYTDAGRVFTGYRISQAIDVKIRDINKTGNIIDAATKLGVNDVGTLRFEVDDIDDVKQQARIEALANAKEKAEEMAGALGVKLGRIVSFSEDTIVPQMPIFAREATFALGSDVAVAPTIEPGVTDVTATVFVTFEIL